MRLWRMRIECASGSEGTPRASAASPSPVLLLLLPSAIAAHTARARRPLPSHEGTHRSLLPGGGGGGVALASSSGVGWFGLDSRVCDPLCASESCARVARV